MAQIIASLGPLLQLTRNVGNAEGRCRNIRDRFQRQAVPQTIFVQPNVPVDVEREVGEVGQESSWCVACGEPAGLAPRMESRRGQHTGESPIEVGDVDALAPQKSAKPLNRMQRAPQESGCVCEMTRFPRLRAPARQDQTVRRQRVVRFARLPNRAIAPRRNRRVERERMCAKNRTDTFLPSPSKGRSMYACATTETALWVGSMACARNSPCPTIRSTTARQVGSRAFAKSSRGGNDERTRAVCCESHERPRS